MNGFVAQLSSLMLGPVRQRAGKVARAASLALAGLLFGIVSLGFFIAAVAIQLDRLYGPVTAALAVGCAFLMLAVIVAFVLVRTGRASGRGYSNSRGSVHGAADLDGQAGLSRPGEAVRNQAALLQGLLTASQLKPYELVGLSIVAGFLLGHRSKNM
jgi:hypothetical protein